jgi:trans-aconitate methyltransferase
MALIPQWNETAYFDQYAGHYDESINQALSLSGENRDYFLLKRVEWLAQCLAKEDHSAKLVMDFGCGTGTAAPLLLNTLGAKAYIGVDTSTKSMEAAIRIPGCQFYELSKYDPRGEIDLVYCNGVFHHIALDQRNGAIDYLYRSLKPGGLLALWENNPLNPVTRYMMSRIPFDRDAITLRATRAGRLAASGGFSVLRTDYLFLFPHWLSSLRRFEELVSRFPLGAQYQVLCRKPF